MLAHETRTINPERLNWMVFRMATRGKENKKQRGDRSQGRWGSQSEERTRELGAPNYGWGALKQMSGMRRREKQAAWPPEGGFPRPKLQHHRGPEPTMHLVCLRCSKEGGVADGGQRVNK